MRETKKFILYKRDQKGLRFYWIDPYWDSREGAEKAAFGFVTDDECEKFIDDQNYDLQNPCTYHYYEV